MRLVRVKSNIGPDGSGFEYDLQRITIDPDKDIQGQGVSWGALLEGSAQSLLAEVESAELDDTVLGRAKVWLPEFLGTGSGASLKAIRDAAEATGLSWATVMRAKDALGVEAIKQQTLNGGWAWRMPKVLMGAEDARQNTVSTLSAFEDAQNA